MIWDRFADPRFIIALVVIGLFGWAFGADPTDETMKGALIAGFAGAWGFYLGSSRGASDNAVRADKALEIAHEATRAMPVADRPTGTPADPVSVKEAP